jgi:hypothetical protein
MKVTDLKELADVEGPYIMRSHFLASCNITKPTITPTTITHHDLPQQKESRAHKSTTPLSSKKSKNARQRPSH